MYRSIFHIVILITFVTSSFANINQETVNQPLEEQNDILNKILEFKSANDGISYEYIDFEDDSIDEDEEILLQNEAENFSPLGRLMTT